MNGSIKKKSCALLEINSHTADRLMSLWRCGRWICPISLIRSRLTVTFQRSYCTDSVATFSFWLIQKLMVSLIIFHKFLMPSHKVYCILSVCISISLRSNREKKVGYCFDTNGSVVIHCAVVSLWTKYEYMTLE